MFSVTHIMADGYIEEDPLHGLQAHHIWILWIFTCGDNKNLLCTQILLTTKRYFTIALRMPVRLSTTTPAS
jgi:hypothetical protein